MAFPWSEAKEQDFGAVDPREVTVGSRFVARLFGVTPQALEGWRDHEECPAEKVGGEWRYPLGEIVQWRRAKDEEQAENVLVGEPEAGTSPMLEKVREERWKKLKIERRRMEEKVVDTAEVERDLRRGVAALRRELVGVAKEFGCQNELSDAIDRFLEVAGYGDD